MRPQTYALETLETLETGQRALGDGFGDGSRWFEVVRGQHTTHCGRWFLTKGTTRDEGIDQGTKQYCLHV